jgi:hypothetical protein
VSYNPFGLVTDWLPAVAAYRDAGVDGLWEDPPFATVQDYPGGWAFRAAEFYYDSLRPFLPAPLRAPADAYWSVIYGDERPDDLAADSGVPHEPDERLWYAMRPSTAAATLALARAVPWTEIGAIADRFNDRLDTDESYVRDFACFELPVSFHERWLRTAANEHRGLVVLIS